MATKKKLLAPNKKLENTYKKQIKKLLRGKYFTMIAEGFTFTCFMQWEEWVKPTIMNVSAKGSTPFLHSIRYAAAIAFKEKELFKTNKEYIAFTKGSGFFEEQRKQQSVIRMHNTIIEYFNNSFYNQEDVRLLLPELEKQLYEGRITSFKAAVKLLDKYFKR